MVDAETGVRGYQLTGRTEYLEPFTDASAELPTVLGRLETLAAAEPGEEPRTDKLARIAELQDLTSKQMTDLARQRDVVAAGGDTDGEIRQDLAYGKNLMDGIRSRVDQMRTGERELLDDRIDEINQIRLRDYLSVGIALAVAVLTRFLAWFLHRNGILRRVDRLADTVRVIREGGPLPEPPPLKRDRMGELEREVHLLEPATPARRDDAVDGRV